MMSRSGMLQIAEDEEEQPECGCSKVSFGICNSFAWLISIALIGLAAWHIAESANSATAAAPGFSWSLLTVSLVTFVMCVVGFLASLTDHLVLTGIYLIMFVLVISTEASLLLICYSTYPTAAAAIQRVWSESSPYLIETTESRLKCCGLTTWNDTYSSLLVVPTGCIDSDTNTIYQNGCIDSIITYFTETVSAQFIVLLILPSLIQVFALIAAIAFFYNLWQEARLEEGKWQRSYSRNQIVPILVSPVDVDEEEGTSGTQNSKSATSNRDVRLNVSTPGQPSNKGNEALFKVAGVMLG